MRLKNVAFGLLVICLVFSLLVLPGTASRVFAAEANSIVGTWTGYVDWGCDGSTVSTGPWIFNADGSWTYSNGGGQWIQVGDMVAWNFNNAAGLIYTANLGRNSMQGIMGYASETRNRTGCFYALPQKKGKSLSEAAPLTTEDASIGL
ncbi:MAG: hypothetical protein PVH64_13295 [Bacillota bacterium]|jgi:hypothetical protein